MIGYAVRFLAWTALVFLSAVIALNSAPYLSADSQPPFVMERPWLASRPVWRATLAVHAAGGIVCLLSCLMQFHRPTLRRFPAAHRVLGRVYVASLLCVLCPTGFYLACFAKGGAAGALGFHLMGAVTFWTTWRGWIAMRRRDTLGHIVWMIRSFAMATTAITFRLWNIGLYAVGLEEPAVYLGALYLSFAGNAAAAELAIFRFGRRRGFHIASGSDSRISKPTTDAIPQTQKATTTP